MRRSSKQSNGPASADETPDIFPNMIPFIAKNKLKENPTPEDVDQTFDQLLTELDYHGKMLTTFTNWSTQQKLDFIQHQENYEKRVPSPEWLIEQFSKAYDPHLVTSINLSIRTARLSWIDRFCTSGGHILLLRELARLTAFSQYFHHSFPYKNGEQINEIVKALKSCVDCRHGSQHMLYFVPGIEIITTSINRFDFRQFETLLYLLVPYVFMDSGPKLLVNSFKHLSDLNQQKHVFRIFSDMIQVNPEACARSEVFLAFINGLYTTLSQNFDDKMEIVFHYLRSDLINKLSNLAPEISSQFGPALPVFLESIKTDIEEISQLFNGEVFKCANVEDMVNELNRSSIGAIVTNLISIARNQPQVADRLYAFLYHFLLFYRKQLSDPSLSFEEAAFKSFDYATPQTEIEAPELPESSVVKNNTAYQYLNKEYKFVADGDFALMAKDFTEGEKQKEISQLREQLASLQQELNQTKEELFEAEQRAAAAQIGRTQAEQDEIANYKREIEAQIRSEVKTEVEKMREELENVKAENEKLRASQSIISELAAYIPDLKKIELKPLEVNQVLSPSKVDLNALLGQVAKIKADGNASDPNVSLILNTLEAQLRLLAEERSNNERNAEDAIQKVREDRVALTAEYNQIRDIQIKIINGLSSGKMYDIFNDDEQNAEDDENAPIDQSRIQPNTPPASGPTYNFPWIKLSDRQCLASKEWTSVCEHLPEVNAEEVQKYFAVHENPEGKLLSERTQKRLRHILTKTKMTPEAISRELNSQSFKLSEEILTLVFHLPLSPKEMESLAAFNGDVKTLDDAERLGILLYRIPEWRLKVEQSIELHRFDHDFTILMQNLDKISLALTQLKESTKLPILLAAVLALGNHLNGGTGYGGASGFSLSNLKDLKFIKSNIKGVSLLNYIAHTLIRNGFDLTELQAELNKLQPASRYTILDINEKLKNAQIMLAARPRDPFVRASSRRVYDALQKVNAVQREYYRILRVFGIREELLRPGSLIPLILDFTSDLSRALKENRTNGLESASSAVSTPTRTYQRHTSVPPTPPPMLQDDEKQRGILTKMVGALSQSSRVERNISESQQEMSEFQKAFAKVRKSVL